MSRGVDTRALERAVAEACAKLDELRARLRSAEALLDKCERLLVEIEANGWCPCVTLARQTLAKLRARRKEGA